MGFRIINSYNVSIGIISKGSYTSLRVCYAFQKTFGFIPQLLAFAIGVIAYSAETGKSPDGVEAGNASDSATTDHRCIG